MFVSRLLKDRRVVAMTGSVALSLIASQTGVSHAESVSSAVASFGGVTVGINIANDTEILDDEAKWEYKRKSCSVCKMFLESPCKTPFKTWTTCSDDAKANGLDPNSVCSQLSQDLLACTNINDDFFRAQANEATLLRKQQMEARRSRYRLSLSAVPESAVLQPSVL